MCPASRLTTRHVLGIEEVAGFGERGEFEIGVVAIPVRHETLAVHGDALLDVAHPATKVIGVGTLFDEIE